MENPDAVRCIIAGEEEEIVTDDDTGVWHVGRNGTNVWCNNFIKKMRKKKRTEIDADFDVDEGRVMANAIPYKKGKMTTKPEHPPPVIAFYRPSPGAT